MVPSEQQPWVGEFGSWHRRLLDNATSVGGGEWFHRDYFYSQSFVCIVTQVLVCTCGTLLELLIFLFPPLPGLEDASQAGQLAAPANGWSVDPRHQTTGSPRPLLVYKLYCSYCQRKTGALLAGGGSVCLRYSSTLTQTEHTPDPGLTYIYINRVI